MDFDQTNTQAPRSIGQPPVQLQVSRFLEVAARERNLAPAFIAALEVRRDLAAQMAKDGTLADKYEFWADARFEDHYYEFCNYEDGTVWLCPPADQVLALIDRPPERLLTIFVYESPTSGAHTYTLVRDVGGYDLLYCEADDAGYPLLLTRPTGEPGVEEAITTAICSRGGLADGTITNWQPSVVSRQAIQQAFEKEMRELGESPDAILDKWNEEYAEEQVSRQEAASIAERHCRRLGWSPVAEVRDVGDWPAPQYRGHPLRRCWVVWPVRQPSRRRRVVLVCKHSGQILYAGVARPTDLPEELRPSRSRHAEG